MIFIMISTIFFCLFFQSLGNSFLLLLRINNENPFLSIWMGFFFGALLGLFMAIWMPLDHYMARLALGVAVLLGIRPTIRAWRMIFSIGSPRAFLLCGCAFCLLLLIQGYYASCFRDMPYDTNLYHQQIVLWLKEYGLVPGLGNLHCRLAQVSGWLALAAIVDWGPFQSRAAFIMPSLCFLSAFLYFLYGICHAYALSKRIYLLFMMMFGIIYAFNPSGTAMIALYYDRSALILYIIFIAELLPVFFKEMKSNSLRNNLKISAILISASFLFKPIAIPAIIFYCILLCVFFYNKRINYRDLFSILWIPIFVLALWVTLNILLSGYPFFPFKYFRVPLDWTMRDADVDFMRRGVQGYARWPKAGWDKALDSGIHVWFFPWLKRSLANSTFRMSVVAPLFGGGILWLVAFWKKGDRWKKFFFCSLTFSHLFYWFFQHPDLRFGLEFFGSWMALALVFSIPRKYLVRFNWFKDAFLILLLTVCVFSVQCFRTLPALNTESIFLQKLLKPVRHMPYEHVRAHTLHAGTLEEFILYTSFPKHELCGNSPLPCAPTIDKELFLRTPGDLSGGFSIRKSKE